jgi:hypothetical protein
MTRSALPLQSKQGPREWLRADDVIALGRRGVYRRSEIALYGPARGARRPNAGLSGPTFVPDDTADAS